MMPMHVHYEMEHDALSVSLHCCQSVIDSVVILYFPDYKSQFFTTRHVSIARTMLSQDVCPSVCLSVCPSHAGIVSKQLYISSEFFNHRVAPPF